MRVKMNNRKKEEEALERLRIIKMREQQIEAIKRQQRAPQRAISKSPCRTRFYQMLFKSVLLFVSRDSCFILDRVEDHSDVWICYAGNTNLIRGNNSVIIIVK